MSVKCEEPIDELTVQVWVLYDHQNFKYCTLFVSGTELRTDRQADGRTDRQTDRQTNRRSDYWMPPADLSGRGHKNISLGWDGSTSQRHLRRRLGLVDPSQSSTDIFLFGCQSGARFYK